MRDSKGKTIVDFPVTMLYLILRRLDWTHQLMRSSNWRLFE